MNPSPGEKAVNSLRVAYLIPHSELAGGERLMLDLCTHLDKSRFTPFVILPKEGGLAHRFRAAGVTVAILPFRRDFLAGYPPGFNPLSLARLVKKLAEWKIDLLHLNDSYLALLGGLAGKILRIPVVLTAHGIWDAHFLLQDVLNRMFVEKIWFPTERVGEALQRRGIVPASCVRHVPFAVDTTLFSPGPSRSARKKLGISMDVFVVLRVARFDTVKDYPTFLAMAERLAADDPTIRFLVLGDTLLDIPSEPADNKRAFLSFLEERPTLKEKFLFMGYQEDVAFYLEACDVLVSSSISESFGLNLVEAMAMEKPVVSTNTGGPSEIVVEGLTGRLVPAGDASALAEAVLDLIRNPRKRLEMGRHGRERAVRYFDVKRYADTLQQEYEDLLKIRS